MNRQATESHGKGVSGSPGGGSCRSTTTIRRNGRARAPERDVGVFEHVTSISTTAPDHLRLRRPMGGKMSWGKPLLSVRANGPRIAQNGAALTRSTFAKMMSAPSRATSLRLDLAAMSGGTCLVRTWSAPYPAISYLRDRVARRAPRYRVRTSWATFPAPSSRPDPYPIERGPSLARTS